MHNFTIRSTTLISTDDIHHWGQSITSEMRQTLERLMSLVRLLEVTLSLGAHYPIRYFYMLLPAYTNALTKSRIVRLDQDKSPDRADVYVTQFNSSESS